MKYCQAPTLHRKKTTIAKNANTRVRVRHTTTMHLRTACSVDCLTPRTCSMTWSMCLAEERRCNTDFRCCISSFGSILASAETDEEEDMP